jgi:hypothetical protein
MPWCSGAGWNVVVDSEVVFECGTGAVRCCRFGTLRRRDVLISETEKIERRCAAIAAERRKGDANEGA